jgi:alpha-beta hydrolase superfamily lysophospholipase
MSRISAGLSASSRRHAGGPARRRPRLCFPCRSVRGLGGGITLVAAVVLLAACGGEPDRRAASKGAATAAPTAAPTGSSASRPPAGRRLVFRASDGRRLTGTFTPAGRRAPAIVLSHQYRGGPGQFDPLIPVLHQAGYGTLAYASRSTDELDETLLSRDVVGAVRALRRQRDVDPRRIALIGASIGGAAAVWTIATHAELHLRAAVGLSAVEGPAMIQAGQRGAFRPHDLLLISDRREHADAVNIRADAHGRGVRSFVASSIGHGVALLPDAHVRERVVAWLRPRLAR